MSCEMSNEKLIMNTNTKMIQMRKIFFSIVVLILSFSAGAQYVYDYQKAADAYFQKGDYASAAEYYEKYLGRDKQTGKEFNPYTPQSVVGKKSAAMISREKATYQLAECYRLLNYPSKAEPVYKEVMDMNKAGFPLAQYHYASMLRALAKYAESEQNFKTFLDEYKNDDDYRRNAERELQNLQFIQVQLKKKDLKYYTVTKAPELINATGANYAPVWLNTNTLLFTSTRPEDTAAKKKEYTNRVYQAVYTEGSVGDITKTELPQGKDIQQGVVSITPDGNTLFVTRWSVNSKTETSSIYTSTKTDAGWSEPVKLDESVNATGFHSQQPFITANGKYLLYASNKPGGQGGYDLWYAELVNGKPGASMNMGAVINTSFDEQAPYYHEASKALIFSSNGRVGMGGYDFFQSKGTIGNWAAPENLGYPTNSIKDDIYFTSRGSEKNILGDVLLSSDRDAACCLELYSLKKIRPMRLVSGRIVSCDPNKTFGGGTVTVIDPVNNKVVYTKEVGPDGMYSLMLEDYQPLKVEAKANEFIAGSLNFNAPPDPEEESMKNPDLCLIPVPPKVDEVFVVNNLYYEFDKATIKPESYPAMDDLVKMLNTYPTLTIEISAHTDAIGSDDYNQKLSEARAKNVVAYLVSKGIDPARLESKGYGETMPVAPNKTENGRDNPEGREKNRRTEFKVLKN